MTPKDDTWQDRARYIRDGAKRYLETMGFGDHDIDDLRLAKPLDAAPKESGVEAIFHLLDPRPRAEIVATAHAAYIADAALRADELGDQDLATSLMYRLGMLEQQAKVFIFSPGKDASIVEDTENLPFFVYLLDQGATSDAKGRYSRKFHRRKQATEKMPTVTKSSVRSLRLSKAPELRTVICQLKLESILTGKIFGKNIIQARSRPGE